LHAPDTDDIRTLNVNMVGFARRRPLRAGLTSAGCVLLLTLLMPASSLAQGIAYEVSPAYTFVQWDDALGLRDDYLIGGQLGLRFGRLVQLRGYYLDRQFIESDATLLPPIPGFTPPDGLRDVRAQHYGADIRMNLLSGRLVPFVIGGGGILRFNPEGLEANEHILLKAGAGVRFDLFRGLGGEIFAENWAFRIDRAGLFAPPGTIEDPEAGEVRHSRAFGGALNVSLGGDVRDPTPGLRGATITVEPVAGQLSFSDDLGFDRQNVFGLRAGLDVNRLVGLRAFYWTGVDDDFSARAPIQAYGGEVQLNVGSGTGIIPFLVGGAGQIEFRDGFGGDPEFRRDNQPMLVVGGGVSLGLTDRLRATAAVRDYILSESEFSEVRDTEQVTHNLAWSAGVSFAVGGRRSVPLVLPADPVDREEIERLRAENERLRRIAEQRLAVTDTVIIDIDPVTGDTLSREVVFADPGVRAPVGAPQVLQIPVPERGEIIIRFGDPFTGIASAPPAVAPTAAAEVPTTAELRALIREAVRQEAGLAPAPGTVPGAAPATDAVALLEQRLLRQFESALARQAAEQSRRIAQAEAARGVTTIVREAATPQVIFAPPAGAPAAAPAPRREPVIVDGVRTPERFDPHYIRAYMGANLNSPSQFIFGGRVDLGSIQGDLPVHFVPEAALGFGDEQTSVLLAASLQYDFLNLRRVEPFVPYVHAGLGLRRDEGTALGMNYGIGVSAPLGMSPGGPLRVFIEQQGVGILRRMRFLVGTQVQF
jgi:hypothetical protein